MCNLYMLLSVHSTLKLSLLRLVILIQALCKIVLDVTCNVFGMCFGNSQIYLPIVKRLFSSKCSDSNLGSFCPGYSKFAVYDNGLDHQYLSCLACFKMEHLVVALSLQVFSAIHVLIWIYTSASHLLKNFISCVKRYSSYIDHSS